MKTDNCKLDAAGKLKNGVFKENFTDGTPPCTGEYRDGEKTGE